MKINEQKITINQPKDQQLFQLLDNPKLEGLTGGNGSDTLRVPIKIKHNI